MNSTPAWKFVINEPGSPAREEPIENGMTFGRHESCECRLLADSWVSKRHATVVRTDDGKLAIEDRGSANGVQVVGGEKLREGERHVLEPGVSFLLGKTVVSVAAVSTEQTTSGAAAVPGLVPPKPSKDAAPEPLPDAPTVPQSTPPVPPGPQPPDAAVRAAPSPPAAAASEPAPAKPAAPSSQPIDGGTIQIEQQTTSWKMTARMAFRPRLVITTEEFRGVVYINSDEFSIGRAAEGPDGADHVISHDTVSSRHATIVFNGYNFKLTDENSTNGTWVDGARVPPRAERELEPESHVRFGQVDAIFVVDADESSQSIDPRIYSAAVDILSKDSRKLGEAKSQAIDAARDNNRTIGEELLLEGFVGANDWNRAFRKARRLVDNEDDFDGSGGNLWLLILLGAIFVVLTVVAVLVCIAMWG